MAWAGAGVSLWQRIESQVRGSQSGAREAPVNLFNQIAVTGLPRETRLDLYSQFTREFGPDTNDFHLYALSMDVAKIAPWLGMTAGRQTVIRANVEGLMDGASVRIAPGDHGLFFDLYGGFTRSVEMGDFRARPGLLTGGQVGWRPTADTSLAITSFYRRNDYQNRGWDTSATQVLGLTGSHRFGTGRTALVYVDATYDAAGKVLAAATVGGTWQATPRWMVSVSGNRYDTSRARTPTTILSLFTDDDLWQARAGVRYTPNTTVSVFANYDWQQLEAGGRTEYGHVAEGGCDWDWKKQALGGTIRYRLLDSYGGRAHDFLMTTRYDPWKTIGLDQFTNITKYAKVTNETDTAVAAGLGVAYHPRDWIDLRTGGEYLSNNHFSNDWRFTGSLALHWEKGT
ncbi:MAG: hypothetical protein HYV03_05820 [Deltaproteobacteria bacterium]|nr:hypothetical protein [Deltaproteobacteria bacterium]